MREVPLGSIDGICNGIPTTFVCGEGKCHHLGLPVQDELLAEK